MEKLIELANKIENKDLRERVIDFLKNPLPTHKDIDDTGIKVENSPASVKRHHKYSGGLIEHILAVTEMALKMAEVLDEVYGLSLDKDLIIAGGLLHDIMKPQNYIEDGEKFDHIPNFHLDHLTLGVAELYKRDFPIEVIKIVANHHGEYSPSRPDSIEAWLLHYADNVDASINDIAIKVCQARARDLNVEESEIYKKVTPLKIYEMRSKEGKEKLKEFLKETLDLEEE